MNREQIEKWAREADIYAYGECGTFSSGGAWMRTRDEHFARLVREAALEEAKVLSDQHARNWWTIHCATNKHMETTRKAHDDFCRLSNAIAALIAKEPS